MPQDNTMNLLRQLFAESGVREKKAEAPLSEAGSIGGETSHPVKNVDDHLIHLQTGARASENSEDVKKDQGALSVENAPDVKYTESFDEQYKMQLDTAGLKPSTPGDDSQSEDDYKGTKDDPGTSSVMKADDGEKYAAAPLQKLAADLGKRINQTLAAIAADKSAGAAPAAPAADDEAVKAAQAGYAAAEAGAALEGAAQACVERVVKEASLAADLTERYFADFLKRANDEAEADAAPTEPGMVGPGNAPEAGGMPPGGPGGAPPGGGGGGELEQLIQLIAQMPPEAQQEILMALQGAGGGGGMPPGGPGGGMPPEAMPPGAGPEMPPADAMSDAMAAQETTPADLEAKAAACRNPEISGKLRKIASAVRTRREQPDYRPFARTDRAAKAARQQMRETLNELLGKAV